MSIYTDTLSQSPPEDLIRTLAASSPQPPIPSHPSLGLDSPFGLFMSNISAPFYLYASLRGKFLVWDELLANLPDTTFRDDPALDVGCGRGLVLLKIAERKKKLLPLPTDDLAAESAFPALPPPVYGIDIFRTEDQSGNSPLSTYQNAAALQVTPHTVLHRASFTDAFPFRDGVFSLITSNLALHHADRDGKAAAMKEMARVCKPGGHIIVVDLYGHVKDHEAVLLDIGWKHVDLRMVDVRMLYGIWPCQVLTATKPS